ncbi:MAG: hypothetical protein ACRDE6_06010, partial [Candidatus Limnocylindria bacterium]
MTTITIPGRLMRPVATPPARRATLIGFGATLLAGLIIIVGLSAGIALAAADRVLPNVSVAGVTLSGLGRQAATERLTAELPSLSTGSATLLIGDDEATVSFADVGRGYELDAMVDAAFGVGRDDNPLADGIARLRALVHPAALPVIVHAYDAEPMERVTNEIARRFSVAAVDA